MTVASGRPATAVAVLHRLVMLAGVAAVSIALLVAGAPPAAAHGIGPGGVVPRPSFPGVLLDWHLDPLVLVSLLAAGSLYLQGVRRARQQGRPWPRTRTAWFLARLVVVAVALQSAIDTYDTALFSVHAAQHMLLTVVAAPLLALEAPVTLLLQAAPPQAAAPGRAAGAQPAAAGPAASAGRLSDLHRHPARPVLLAAV